MKAKLKYPAIALGVLAIAGLLYGAVVAFNLWQANNSIKALPSVFPTSTIRPDESPGENILLLGADYRAYQTAEIDTLTGVRADTIILVHISDDREHVTMLSVMRDSWVSIPGLGEAKINAALSLGNVATLVETLETLLETRIDRVAAIDFAGFESVVDELGGLTIKNDRAFSLSIPPRHYYPVGKLTLTGNEVLGFVRERKNVPGGDYQRVKNQRKVIIALAKKIITDDVKNNPLKLSATFESLAPYLALDDGFTLQYIANLVGSLRSFDYSNTRQITLPGASTGYTDDGQWAIFLDELALQQMRERFLNDTIHLFERILPSLSPSSNVSSSP
jgi:LCP family protein required for cell wall assembly